MRKELVSQSSQQMQGPKSGTIDTVWETGRVQQDWDNKRRAGEIKSHQLTHRRSSWVEFGFYFKYNGNVLKHFYGRIRCSNFRFTSNCSSCLWRMDHWERNWKDNRVAQERDGDSKWHSKSESLTSGKRYRRRIQNILERGQEIISIARSKDRFMQLSGR